MIVPPVTPGTTFETPAANATSTQSPSQSLTPLPSPTHNQTATTFPTAELMTAVATDSPATTITTLIPLRPTWTVTPAGASDLDLARHTLLTFFTLLHDGRYAEAVPLYGGDYETLRIQNPDIPPDDYAALWQASCTRQTPCLLISRIVEEKLISQDEFEFVVEFVWIDGTLFKLGPCCGATETEMPPVWQFPYTVKKVDGVFKVLEGPGYIP